MLQIRDIISGQVNIINPKDDPIVKVSESQEELFLVVEDVILSNDTASLKERVEFTESVIEELILGGML